MVSDNWYGYYITIIIIHNDYLWIYSFIKVLFMQSPENFSSYL